MKKFISLFLCSILLISLFTGCSNKGSTVSTSSKKSEKDELSEKQELRLYLDSDPANLDPQLCVDSNGGEIVGSCFEPLVSYDLEGKVIGRLAEKWDISEDQKKYVFHLRDAKWSDGTPITANDVVYSWVRAMKPETASQMSYRFYNIVNAEKFIKGELKDESQLGLKVLDEKTFEVNLVRPVPYFLSLLVGTAFRPVKKDYVDSVGKDFASSPDKIIYSGPYKISKWQHQQMITLEKNPQYWNADNIKLDTIVYNIIADENLPLTMYESGDLDFINLDSAFLDKYRDSKEIQTHLINNLTYVSFNCKDEFFKNNDLRKAFSLTIDRDTYVNNVLNNGAKALRGFVPYGFPGGTKDKDFRTHNGDLIKDVSVDKEGASKEAKELLDKALKDLGKTKEQLSQHVSILVWDAEGKKLAQVLQQNWKEYLGIDLKIEPLTLKVCIDKMFAGNYSLLVMGYSSSYIDAMAYLEMYTSDFPSQMAFWGDPKFDECIKKAADVSGDKRMEYLYEAEKIFMDGLPVAPVYNRAHNYLIKPYVKNFNVHPFYGSDLSKVYIGKH